MSMTQEQAQSLADKDFIRYSRQIFLPEVGEAGQLQLKQAHVLIVGLGGLGQLAAQYLACAGVGRLTLVDGDRVELTNLPRQLLFSDDDIGHHKALIAKQKLTVLAQGCEIDAFAEHLTLESANTVFSGLLAHGDEIRLVLDCTDNLAARHCVNRLCIEHALPLVSAAIAAFNGQLFAVDQQRFPMGGCYHCVFPSSTRAPQNCSSQGVLGPSVGVMASMQALLAMQLLLLATPPTSATKQTANQTFEEESYLIAPTRALLGRFWRFDAKLLQWHSAALTRDPECEVCGLKPSSLKPNSLTPSEFMQRQSSEHLENANANTQHSTATVSFKSVPNRGLL
ncbi:HesA/MoeB/ThiF family protein [Shewanella seohaensis]|uniref:HesA/MoeB/ThiF family protein n=1 Tax=Shewanella seohaensis TaxID=755175 RepID=UPI0020105358|nr:HesA/MoeB/ThiF family protein [Shewanella seohaensis]MCL1122573.1 HesA/MoeB/ThiF family protein [Shewanella seohaensis]UXM80901.1 HesA/MoeB/ThiF family protein [Shewanella seohaensis]